MTETLIVMVTAFAGLLFTDPFYGGALTKASIAKVPLLALTVGALVFHLLGRAVTDPARLRRSAGEVLQAWWPALALSLFIIGGSAYARFGEGVKENFLAMGLGMLFLPTAALAVRSSSHSQGFTQGLGVVYLLTAAGMLSVLLAGVHVFHEEIFLIVPLGTYFLTAPRTRIWKLVLGLTLIGACAFSVKNTTFLLILITIACCVLLMLMRLLRKSDRLEMITGLYFAVPIVVAACVALAMAYARYKVDLPSGNVEYRNEMYGIAWRRFLESPIWGTLFTDSSVNHFTLYRVALATQDLPTHSDILDLLSHGGIIAIGLWIAVIWQFLRITWDTARVLAQAEPGGGELRAWRCLFVLCMVQVCAVVTYAVNPPLINPAHGFWIWGSAGVLWALHRNRRSAGVAVKALARPWRGPALA
jgi:O-antigen ligase